MGQYAFFIIVIASIVAILFGKFLFMPIRKIFKFCINSALGLVLLYVINIIGANYGFHIGINWITLICTGLLGIPRMHISSDYQLFVIRIVCIQYMLNFVFLYDKIF